MSFFDQNPQFTTKFQADLKAEAAARRQERALARKRQEEYEEEQRFGGRPKIRLSKDPRTWESNSLVSICRYCSKEQEDVIFGCCPACSTPKKPQPRKEYRPDGVYYFNEEGDIIHSTNRWWRRNLMRERLMSEA